MKYALQIDGENVAIYEGNRTKVRESIRKTLEEKFAEMARYLPSNFALHQLGEGDGILVQDRVQKVEFPTIELVRLSN